MCSSSKLEKKSICNHLQSFKAAGICYIVFLSLATLIAIYSMINIIGKGCGCADKKCLKLDICHFLYPILYSIALVIYLAVSTVFVLDKITVFVGIFSMFLGFLFAWVSFGFYFYNKSIINAQIRLSSSSENLKKTSKKNIKIEKETKNPILDTPLKESVLTKHSV